MKNTYKTNTIYMYSFNKYSVATMCQVILYLLHYGVMNDTGHIPTLSN